LNAHGKKHSAVRIDTATHRPLCLPLALVGRIGHHAGERHYRRATVQFGFAARQTEDINSARRRTGALSMTNRYTALCFLAFHGCPRHSYTHAWFYPQPGLLPTRKTLDNTAPAPTRSIFPGISVSCV